MASLTVTNLAKRFTDGANERWVLKDINFRVEPGQIVTLWGPSGSGKSTLLNVIAGITLPDAGCVQFESTAGPFMMSAAPERHRVRFRRRHLGFVFQFFNLVPTLTAAENIRLMLALNGLPNSQPDARAKLAELGVEHCAQQFPETLSGGEQQRVAIVRAMAHKPRLVLADEPTGNLDHANAAAVTDALWQSTRTASAALIVATHSERVAQRADRVIELA